MTRLAYFCVLVLLSWGPGAALAQNPPPGAAPDYEKDVKPILAARCYSCHGPAKQKSGLRVDQRASLLAGGDSGEPAVAPGKSAASLLIRMVRGTPDGQVMPPQGERLTPAQIATLENWVSAGAPMPAKPEGEEGVLWSLRPVRPPVPPAMDDPFVANSIDAYILARLRSQGLAPSPPADRRVLIRRLFLDLHGLPPTPGDVDAFVNDPSPHAYLDLVNRLLASPRYGERWAQHWLDVVRYGDTDGFEVNTPRPNAWPYRDWVIKAFNEDLPYDQFVTRQLAGDAVGDDAATGFLVAGPALLPGQIGKDLPSILQARQDELHEMVNAAGTAFLGLTIGCARCHHHKFDPIPQADYYALQAVFAGVRHGERPWRGVDDAARQEERRHVEQAIPHLERALDDLEPLASLANDGIRAPVNPRRNVERFPPSEARYVRFTVEATNNGIEPCIDELEVYATDAMGNVALAARGAKSTSSSNFPHSAIHQLAHLNDGRYGNGRSWISNEPGKGWVQLELPRVETIDRIVWGRDREGKFTDRLATAYRIEIAVEEGAWRTVATSGDRQPFGKPVAAGVADERSQLRQKLDVLAKRAAELAARPSVFAGVFQTPEPTHRLYRGDPMQKREPIAPDGLSALRSDCGPLGLNATSPEQERRLALARWITRPDHPLTARVMVNRLWQHHFGTGIVDTPSDFGRNGSPPSHPELLDYLASEFVRSGWSLKAMHRLIVTSSTYRQASTPRPEDLKVDAQCRLLWRYPPRRLEAEAIRDAVLATSGALDLRGGGPGFMLFKPNDNYVRVYDPKEDWSPGDWRRMVYAHKVRMAQDGVFGAFDCPDAGLPAPRRGRSTTAIQALNLLNSTFMMQQAELFAQRIEREAGADLSAQVRHAFALAFQRPPSASEEAAALTVTQRHGLAAACRALLNANEFLFLP